MAEAQTQGGGDAGMQGVGNGFFPAGKILAMPVNDDLRHNFLVNGGN